MAEPENDVGWKKVGSNFVTGDIGTYRMLSAMSEVVEGVDELL